MAFSRRRGVTTGATRRGKVRDVLSGVAATTAGSGGGSSGGSGGGGGLTSPVAFADLDELAGLSVLGRSANSTGVMAAITAANDLEVLRRSGTSIGFGKVAYGGIQDVSATSRILGRKSSGSGIIEELTTAEVLDFLASTQGNILYRGSSAWAGLAPGSTPGMLLQTGGSGADPSWVSAGAVPSDQGLFGSSSFFAWLTNINGVQAYFYQGAINTTNGSVIGTNPSVNVIAGDNHYQRYTSGNVAGNPAGLLGTTQPQIDWGLPFDITMVIRTSTDIGNIRFWFGMAAAAGTNSDSYGGVGTLGRFVGFRYSTVAGDGGWVGVNNNATTQSNTATVGSIATSTKYKLRIRSTGSQSFFSVNGSAEVGLATTFPGGATRVGFVHHLYTTNAAVKTFDWSRTFGTFGQ